MKYLLFILLVCLSACATSMTMLNDGYGKKDKDAKIDFYDGVYPNRPYIQVAEIKSASLWGNGANRAYLADMARKVGADAVVIVGGSIVDSLQYGYKAIAIKYQ